MWNAKPEECLWLDLNRMTEERLDQMSNWARCTNVWLHEGPGCVNTIIMEVWSPGPWPGLRHFLSLTWPVEHIPAHTNTLPALHQETQGRTHTQVTFKCPHSQPQFTLCMSVRVCSAILGERGRAWLHDRRLPMNHIKLALCLLDESVFALLASFLGGGHVLSSSIIHWQYLIFLPLTCACPSFWLSYCVHHLGMAQLQCGSALVFKYESSGPQLL